MKSVRFAIATALAGTAGFTLGAVMLVAPTGCGSDCDVPFCPPVEASIQTEANVDLPITNIERAGPSCPQTRPLCRGDSMTTFCTHTEFYGGGPGFCEVRITFADRPAQIVEFTFGEKTCCPGTPIIGESTYYIPLNPDAAIYSAHDAGNDAVRIEIPSDAGATDAADGATDGDVTDGGTD